MGCKSQFRSWRTYQTIAICVVLAAGQLIYMVLFSNEQQHIHEEPIPVEIAQLHKEKDFAKPFEVSEEQQEKTLSLLNILEDDETRQRSFIFDLNLKLNQISAKDTNLSILTISAKRAPVLDIAQTLQSRGVNLTILDLKSVITGEPYGLKFPQYIFQLEEKDIDMFYHQNQNNTLLKSVDAFLCVYPLVLCELFQPFEKPFILYIEDRYQAGSHHYHEWKFLNDFMTLTSHNPRSSILASNTYDVEYVRHFTGLVPMHVPYSCSYLSSFPAYKAKPQREKTFLVWSTIGNKHVDRFVEQLRESMELLASRQIHVDAVSEFSSQQHYMTSLSQYSAVIVFPHQVSFLAFTELYRMNIPLFVPSLDLLTTWHQQQHVLTHKGCRLCALQSPHLQLPHKSLLEGVMTMPDPNNDSKTSAIGYWLMHSDFYQLEHLINFLSVQDLVEKLENVSTRSLQQISSKMAAKNAKIIKTNNENWSEVLMRINSEYDGLM